MALAVRPALDLEGAEAAGALVLDPVVSEVSLPGRWESARVLAELESELAPRERLRLAWTSYLAGTRPTLRERARVLLLSDLDGEGDLDGGGGDLDGDDDAGEPTREAPPSRPTVEEALTLAEQLLGVDRDLTVRLTGHLRTWCTRPSQLVRLASLLGHAHRTEDSRTVLETLDLAAPAAEQLLGAELTRAFLLAQAESQPLAAIEVLDRATARFGPNPLTSAVRATALWRAGRFVAARALALDVIGDHAAPIEAVLHARLAHASSSLYAGTTGEVGVSLAWVLAHADEVPTLPEGREAALLIGLGRDLLAGAPVEEGATAAEVGYQEALRAGNDGARAQYAHFRALAQLLGARPAAAATGLEASAGLEGQWVVATRPWVDRTHVEALATAGRGAAAQAALAGLVARPHASMYELDRALAVAVVAATQGRVAEAIDGLARAARSVEGPGGPGSVAWTRYRAVTWGSTTAAHELARTRGEVPLNRGQLDHARALAAGSTAALLQAAAALSATGHHWYAAAAALQALERAEFGQRRERAQAWHVLAGAVREERVVLPQLGAVVGADTGYLLSGREREVAAGAASGLSNAALARALGISARTAETYLARVLGRLGISSRSEIAGRLALLDRIAVAPLEEGAPSSSPSPSLLPSWSSEKVPPPTSGT